MPEMPEVEIIRRQLALNLRDKQIMNIDIFLERLIKWPTAEEFRCMASGRRITDVDRSGKYLLLRIETGKVVVIHLRMTGRLVYTRAGDEVDKYARIIFHLADGNSLVYADTRTLGTLYGVDAGELWRISGLANMGPEPLSDKFTLDYLTQICRGNRGKIKSFLLNQKYIGGLGNIYVDEALFLAGIHPERVVNTLSGAELPALYAAINKVIAEGIRDGGTTFRDYRNGAGEKGSHQDNLRVYGRKGLPCCTCGNNIMRIEVGGRGTHYCPQCQPKG